MTQHFLYLEFEWEARERGTRLPRTVYFMILANIVAQRATCVRREVGCVLINELSHIIATGYNGTARRTVHCLDVPCEGAELPSGTGLDKCEAIHAEQNALLQCSDVNTIYEAFLTCTPCIHCMKLLMNTSVRTIYYDKEYQPHIAQVRELADKRNIKLVHLPITEYRLPV